VEHTRHLKAIWTSFAKGPESKAIKEEEKQTEMFLQVKILNPKP